MFFAKYQSELIEVIRKCFPENCDNENEKTSEQKGMVTTSTRQTIVYPQQPQNTPSSTPIIVYTCLGRWGEDEKVFTLSDEDSDNIKSLLNELEWINGITKTEYEYVLELPDKIIYYSPAYNRLNNKIDNINVELSDEQNELMKSILGYEEFVPTTKK